MTNAIRCRVWLGLAALGVLASVLYARMLVGAQRELAAAARAELERDVDREVLHLRRGIAYYLPGNPWVTAAVERLGARCQALSTEDRTRARQATEQLRSALLSIRSVYQPYASELDRAVRLLSRLLAAPPSTGERPLIPFDQRARRFSPRPQFVVLGVLGFVVWVLGALALIYLGLSAGLDGRRPRFLYSLGAIGVGLALFVLGLALA